MCKCLYIFHFIFIDFYRNIKQNIQLIIFLCLNSILFNIVNCVYYGCHPKFLSILRLGNVQASELMPLLLLVPLGRDRTTPPTRICAISFGSEDCKR